MPLYNLDDKRQPPICQGEHWRLFEGFLGSSLCEAIEAELEPYYHERGLRSRIVGSAILKNIEARSPDLFRGHEDDELIGALFGMTLWYHLAQRPENWVFYPDEESGTNYFRRG